MQLAGAGQGSVKSNIVGRLFGDRNSGTRETFPAPEVFRIGKAADEPAWLFVDGDGQGEPRPFVFLYFLRPEFQGVYQGTGRRGEASPAFDGEAFRGAENANTRNRLEERKWIHRPNDFSQRNVRPNNVSEGSIGRR